MPKLKILFIISILLLFSTRVCGQTDLGIGLVSIHLDDKTILEFYSDTLAQKPVKVVELFDDQTINGWNIRDLDKHKEWLKPEILWLDYSQFVFRCLTVHDHWLKVMVNNETGETLWIKKSNRTTYSSWENFLKEMFAVARVTDPKQIIRSLPNENADEIIYQGRDCFHVKSMQGDWIEISTADHCDENDTGTKTKISSGWIRWRKGNKLLIEYITAA